MAPSPLLWPPVKQQELLGGTCLIPTTLRYGPPELAAGLEPALAHLASLGFANTPHTASDRPSLDLALGAGLAAGHYRLTIGGRGITLEGGDGAALAYGIYTLASWLAGGAKASQGGWRVPTVRIDDWADFPVRAVMLDISRDKVPTLQTLHELIDALAVAKINQLQLYTEHTFAYHRHERVWRDASPLHAHEVSALDRYCAERFIELVPNQNSLGHFHRWLIHQPYRKLAECPEGIEHPFSPTREPFSLCSTDPAVFALLSDLYAQLLPCFQSRSFNVGLDEAFDLGACRSATAAAARGKNALLVDYVAQVRALAASHGRSIQYWADMFLGETPPLDQLATDDLLLLWGYEADHPFEAECALLAQAGMNFYVCPGTSSWNSFVGRTSNALGNLRAAARAGRASGAGGYLITDWGDNGHHQPLAISQLPLCAGAAMAWSGSAAEEASIDTLARASDGIFKTPGLGAILAALGDAHLLSGACPKNSTAPFNLGVRPTRPLDHAAQRGITVEGLHEASALAGGAIEQLKRLEIDGTPGGDHRAELTLAAELFQLGCRIGIARLEQGGALSLAAIPVPTKAALALELERLIAAHRQLWPLRNRPGGLEDSIARFTPLLELLSS